MQAYRVTTPVVLTKVLDIAELVAASMKGGTGPISGGFASKEAASAEH